MSKEKKIKITLSKGLELEDVLEKANYKVKNREAVKTLRDPYLRKQQEYANAIYDRVENAMIKEIVEFLYKNQ